MQQKYNAYFLLYKAVHLLHIDLSWYALCCYTFSASRVIFLIDIHKIIHKFGSRQIWQWRNFQTNQITSICMHNRSIVLSSNQIVFSLADANAAWVKITCYLGAEDQVHLTIMET